MVVKVIDFKQLPDELDKMIDNIAKEAGKTKSKTVKEAGTFMIKTAKAYAPRGESLETSKGITGHKEGTSYAVESKVNNPGFSQNVWADNRKGYYGTRSKVAYPGVQRTGITGGGFFTKAQESTRKYFKDIIIKDISKWKIIK